MATDAAAPAPGPTPPALAATPRARVFALRCRWCQAFVERGDALCAACSEPVAASNAVEDRRKRRAYRAHHGMARASMPDDVAVAHLRPGAHGLQDAEAHARAVHADVDALADKAIGHAHACKRQNYDLEFDSYLSITTLGRDRFIDDEFAGARVAHVSAAHLAGFFSSFVGEAEEHQLTMMPGGFYADFLGRTISLSAVLEFARRVLCAAKNQAFITYASVTKDVVVRGIFAGEISSGSDRVGRLISDYLLSPDGVHEIVTEVAANRWTRPRFVDAPAHERRRLLAYLDYALESNAVKRAAASVLDPLFRAYAAQVSAPFGVSFFSRRFTSSLARRQAHPGVREVAGGPRRRLTASDFSCTLPLFYVRMALRKLATSRMLNWLGGTKGVWKREKRLLRDVPLTDAVSLHYNIDSATLTADGGMHICANTLTNMKARMHYVQKHAHPSLQNDVEHEDVKGAFKSTIRILGRAQPHECEALFDERSTHLHELIDNTIPRDRQFAAAAALGEHCAFRVLDAYLLDRYDVKPNSRGVNVKLPRHKGDQESASTSNQARAACPS